MEILTFVRKQVGSFLLWSGLQSYNCVKLTLALNVILNIVFLLSNMCKGRYNNPYTHVCSTESVDEGLSFSSGILWSNTMVSVLARQNPLDRMISAKCREEYYIILKEIMKNNWNVVIFTLNKYMYLISWLDCQSMAGFCGLCRSLAPDPGATAQRKSASPLIWNTKERGFWVQSLCSHVRSFYKSIWHAIRWNTNLAWHVDCILQQPFHFV